MPPKWVQKTIIGWDLGDGHSVCLFPNRLNMPVECLGSSALVQSKKSKIKVAGAESLAGEDWRSSYHIWPQLTFNE